VASVDNQRTSISAVIITKDEEKNIRACLETLAWVDEIIIVDSCSSDRTVEIARAFTDRVFVRAWPGYGPQKNFGIDQAKSEWMLIIDADERVTNPLREEILQLLRSGAPLDLVGFKIPRRNFFYGRWIRGGGIYPDHQLRLFRRSAGRYDNVPLHEHLELRGPTATLTSYLDHYSMPGIGEHVRKIIRYTTLGAQEKLKVRSQVTPLAIAGNHLATIFKTYVLRGGFRDGVHGIIVALFAGMYTFVKYAKAWELLRQGSTRE